MDQFDSDDFDEENEEEEEKKENEISDEKKVIHFFLEKLFQMRIMN